LVNSKSVPVVSVGACLLVAAVAVAAFAIEGELRAGLALGIGLVIGSTNGMAAQRALGSPMGFRFSSLLRLAFMTVAALGAGALLGLSYAWLVLIGVAAAQLVLVAVAARSLLK
jgi:hypothetical protein